MTKIETKKRQISVVERRLKSGSMFSSLSRPIPMKQPGCWELRVANTELGDQRLWELQQVKGWQYVDVSDLAVDPTEIGFRILDGRVVRGERGKEVLMKMEKADYQRVVLQKEAENRANTFGRAAVKKAVVQAAEREPDGGRGAEFLDKTVSDMQIVDSRERVSLE